MAQIRVNDLTFAYDGSADDVLRDVTFNIDTDWKLGLIGRNGKGKTTLLNLFMGKYDYKGSIQTGTRFDYFPPLLTYRFFLLRYQYNPKLLHKLRLVLSFV